MIGNFFTAFSNHWKLITTDIRRPIMTEEATEQAPLQPSMRIDILTLFPDMVAGVLGASMMKRAAEMGRVTFNYIDPRDFTHDVHRSVDDRPYGGGPGMVMKPGPLCEAIESCLTPQARVILMTPQGTPHSQQKARDLSFHPHLIFVCGHYEGVDERVRNLMIDEELSIGDYVLTNGAIAATVVIDSIVRLLPGVLGAGDQGTEEESFTNPLLEYPQYTRPPSFRGLEVPDILLSGNHGAIRTWREEQALQRTQSRRPDLLDD